MIPSPSGKEVRLKKTVAVAAKPIKNKNPAKRPGGKSAPTRQGSSPAALLITKLTTPRHCCRSLGPASSSSGEGPG